ncbi:MAG: trypsin-like peptidase domain-containing protein [Pseudomonadota bacterium]
MRKPALYSRTPRTGPLTGVPVVRDEPARPEATGAPSTRSSWRQRMGRAATDPRVMWASLLLLSVALGVSLWQGRVGAGQALTQKDVDAAVLRTLTTQVLPSPAARAAEKVRPSVVRVEAFARNRKGEEEDHGVGTGVVIVDRGVILTNLHVVQGADRLRIVFADGSDAGASVTGVQAANDLAVLQADTVPDDLQAATMRSTSDLLPGDQVVAVGFPFGIGPSVSAGVISGFGRSFRAPEGQQDIENLIQFDAAANPGNSGGPLVTMDGEVVGIVTGILNPTKARTFAGIGFAVPIESAAQAAGLPPF